MRSSNIPKIIGVVAVLLLVGCVSLLLFVHPVSDTSDNNTLGNNTTTNTTTESSIFDTERGVWTRVVGIPYEDEERGVVYIYEWLEGAWVQVDKLSNGNHGLALEGEREGIDNWRFSGYHFGRGVFLSSDNTLYIGAPDENDGTEKNRIDGAVYIFKKRQGDWVLVDKVSNDTHGVTLIEHGSFGFDIAGTDDTLAVSDGRRIYMFEKAGDTWQYVSTLDDFIYHVLSPIKIFGDTLAVGVSGERGDPDSAVYIFEKANGSWEQTDMFLEKESITFGNSVSLFENTLAVGSLQCTNKNQIGNYQEYEGQQCGFVRIYEKKGDDGWVVVDEIQHGEYDTALEGYSFGAEVFLTGDTLFVKSTHYTTGEYAFYLFEKQWDGKWERVLTTPEFDIGAAQFLPDTRYFDRDLYYTPNSWLGKNVFPPTSITTIDADILTDIISAGAKHKAPSQ